MERTVRKAEFGDLPRILEIYEYARNFMAATGNPNQWGKTNPPRETLEADITQRNLHVVEENGEIIGLGKHEDLMENCAEYKEISDSQMGGAFLE